MKKRKVFMSMFISLLMVFAVVISYAEGCEPPGCGVVKSDGYINATEQQKLNWTSSSSNNKASSGLSALQNHDANGIRLRGNFTGGVDLYDEQYGAYYESYDLKGGGKAEFYGDAYQKMNTYSEIGEKCGHLKINADNEYHGGAQTSQSNDSMRAVNNGHARTSLTLEGERGKIGAVVENEYSSQYLQVDPKGNYQIGSLEIKTKTSINPKP